MFHERVYVKRINFEERTKNRMIPKRKRTTGQTDQHNEDQSQDNLNRTTRSTQN